MPAWLLAVAMPFATPTWRDPLLKSNEEAVFDVRQTASIYILLALLGGAISLLLWAVGQPAFAAAEGVVTLLWVPFLLRARKRCVLTRERIIVDGYFTTHAMDLARVRSVKLERDWLHHTLLAVRDDDGRALVVRDLKDAAGVVAVVESLARLARERAEPPRVEVLVRPDARRPHDVRDRTHPHAPTSRVFRGELHQ